MSRVLVDTSVWIDYFANRNCHLVLDELIAKNQVCTNDLVLAELIPSIRSRDEPDLIEGLAALPRYDIQIDWQQIMNLQITNLRHCINGVGIPDLIILENVIANDLVLYTLDKHFRLMKQAHDFRMFAEG